ncbi:hypothetical protein [Novosphingobium sp. Chol11]|uniref:hypothetical protein n=1 Tax=Novosphingobium sp. Chol11 TaxID=1385763 RepID=UPI001141AC5A|nr:hypothetical protein [Novosphingobium sp. Chol11]
MKLLLYKMKGLGWIFFITVLIPTTLAILYYGIFASDVYVSESSFIVKTSERKSPPALGSLLGSVTGYYQDNSDIYSVQNFALSRDAVSQLNNKERLKQIFSSHDISVLDRFAPLGFSASKEDLFRYYKKHVTVEIDSRSALAKIRVGAYRPEDAHWINQQLLRFSEQLVNRLNKRAETDLVAYAERTERQAADQARSAALKLSVYRDAHRVLDPEKQATVQIQLIAKLQDDLIANQSQLDQIQAAVPDNPQIGPLKARIASIKRQIAEESGRVTGGSNSFAGAAPGYQRLQLDSQIADRQLATAMTALADAREEASRKRIYIETVVQPSRPDIAVEPRRLNSILAVFVVGLMAWGVFSMLFAGVREHGY